MRTYALTIAFILLTGRYTGYRLLELKRFSVYGER